MAKPTKRSPMLTKTGKQRLGPLNMKQLVAMLDNGRPKQKAKVRHEILRRDPTYSFAKEEPVSGDNG